MEDSHRPEDKVGKKMVEIERDYVLPTIEFNSGIELNNAFKKKVGGVGYLRASDVLHKCL